MKERHFLSSLPFLHTAANPASVCCDCRLFLGKFSTFSHPAEWSSASKLNVSVWYFKNNLVPQSLYFHSAPLPPPLPQLLHVLHGVGLLPMVSWGTLKIEFQRRTQILHISPRSTTLHNFSDATLVSSCQQFGSSQFSKVTALNLFSW